MKKGLKYLLITGATISVIASTVLGYKVKEISNYIREDYRTEITREPSKGHPKDTFEWGIELLKTMRDTGLYAINDITDKLPEMDIYIDKSTNTMKIYDTEGKLVRETIVGTGVVLQPDKTRFGEYVTPDGEYVVINKLRPDSLERKFDDGAEYYGDGMLQLSGPWAPHIAIHGTKKPEKKIGKYASNGCINVNEDTINWMLGNVGIGSRVHVFMSESK